MSEVIEHRPNCGRRLIGGPLHCTCDYTERYYADMVTRLTARVEELEKLLRVMTNAATSGPGYLAHNHPLVLEARTTLSASDNGGRK